MTSPGAAQPDRRRTAVIEAGLTLLEMLIVLAVIAIASGATLLSLSPRRGDPTEVEARLLATAIQSAVDRSIATGGDAVLAIDAHGYTINGGTRHGLPESVDVRGAVTVLPLSLDRGRPFELVVARSDRTWRVAFDGVRATATAASPA